MIIRLLDLDFNAIAIIDMYESLIWTERYSAYGDFELHLVANQDVVDLMQSGYYLESSESDRLMIIEDILINADAEDGDKLVLSGRSLESILDRRVIWHYTTLDGDLQTVILKLLDENIVSPSVSARKISNFIYEKSENEAVIVGEIQEQLRGENLYDVIKGFCDIYSVGFKVTLNDNGQFVFKLYSGTDRSYGQYDNAFVVLSTKFDNMLTSSYLESTKTLKNVCLIGGEGEGTSRKVSMVGNGSGLDRREMFTDARYISSTSDGVALSTDDYTKLLKLRGTEDLAQNTATKSFEGSADISNFFVFNEDFFVGDIVQVADDYGHEYAARISEMVRSDDPTASQMVPTFSVIE